MALHQLPLLQLVLLMFKAGRLSLADVTSDNNGQLASHKANAS